MYDLSDIVYEVEEKYWDVELAQYVEEPTPNKRVLKLRNNGEPATEEYLVSVLRFYGQALGQFATEEDLVNEEDLEEKINTLSAKVTELSTLINTFRSTLSTLSVQNTKTEETSYSIEEN